MPAMSRRRFLASCAGIGAAGASLSLPIVAWSDVLSAANESPLGAGSRILVLVTMYGGNDGLNTVVPYADSAYYDARPDIAYSADEVLKLDERYGLNPGMRGMADMFRGGSLAIVRGVGYPEPDRSHFRSMDIWQSASLDNTVTTGWIGRWLDQNGSDPLLALHFGRVIPRLVMGDGTIASLFSGESKPTVNFTDLMLALSEHDSDDTPAMKMVCDSYRDADHVNSAMSPLFVDGGPLSSPAIFEERGLTAQLNIVADCIAAKVPTRVYSVAIGGFDTHADELGTQESLLTALDRAVTSFMDKMKTTNNGRDVVLMAYSEFGRRVRANSSDGTDHGTAGPVFLAGDLVKGGFHGEDPTLTDLVDDDLKVTTDFRDVYHEVLTHVLGSDSDSILGKGRKDIGFLTA